MTKHENIKCQTCDLQFKTMGLFRRHMKNVHSLNVAMDNKDAKDNQIPDTSMICSVCSFKAINNVHLKNHMMSQHAGGNLIYCGLCDFKSKTQTQHAKHMKVASAPRHQKKGEDKI